MTYPFQKSRKHLCANQLIDTISEHFEHITDVRPNNDDRKITVHDASMSAFAMMHLKYPSLLSFERDKTEQEVRHNLSHLYQIKKQAPCDTRMREILDPLNPTEFKKPFKACTNCLMEMGTRLFFTLVDNNVGRVILYDYPWYRRKKSHSLRHLMTDKIVASTQGQHSICLTSRLLTGGMLFGWLHYPCCFIANTNVCCRSWCGNDWERTAYQRRCKRESSVN